MPIPHSTFLDKTPLLLKAAVAQGIAWLIALAALWSDLIATSASLLALQAAAAASVAALLRSPWWWWILHLLFVPALGFALQLALPSWVYLVGFILLVLLFGNVARTRVPLYLSNTQALTALEKLLAAKPPGSFLDLGCGVGSVLAALAPRFPETHFYGYEIALIPYWIAKVRCRALCNVSIIRGDGLAIPWSSYEVVYCFLSPAVMAQVEAKACAELYQEALLISNSFALPSRAPDGVIELGNGGNRALFLYRFER